MDYKKKIIDSIMNEESGSGEDLTEEQLEELAKENEKVKKVIDADKFWEDRKKAHDKYIDELDSNLADDKGYAATSYSMQMLAEMMARDRTRYIRASEILKSHSVLGVIKADIRKRSEIVVEQIREQYQDADDAEVNYIADVFTGSHEFAAGCVEPTGWSILNTDSDHRKCAIRKKVVKQNKDGDMMVSYEGACRIPVVISKIITDINTGDEFIELAWRPVGDMKWEKGLFKKSHVYSSSDLVKAAADKKGFPTNVLTLKYLCAYLSDYEVDNFDQIRRSRLTSQLGWTKNNGENIFMMGMDAVISKTESNASEGIRFRPDDAGEKQGAMAIHSKGNLFDWREGIKLVGDYPKIQVPFYASLTAPFLKMLNTQNIIVDIAGKSSKGKSVSLSLAASAWGNPNPTDKDGSLVYGWDATTVGIETLSALMCDIPLFLDDTKRAKSYGTGLNKKSVVPDVVYAVSNGQGRNRGSKSGNKGTKRFRTVMISTGEQRITEFSQDGGTRARVISLWGSPFDEVSPEIAQKIEQSKAILVNNYGVAGPRLVQIICDEWDDIAELLKTSIEFNRKRYMKLIEPTLINENTGEMDGDKGIIERVAMLMATVGACGKLAHDLLELPWKFEDPFVKLIGEGHFDFIETDATLNAVEDLLSWMESNKASRFFVSETSFEGESPTGGWIGYWNDMDNEVAIFPNMLKKFLRDEGYEPMATMRNWMDAGIVKPGKRSGKISHSRSVRFGGVSRYMVCLDIDKIRSLQ